MNLQSMARDARYDDNADSMESAEPTRVVPARLSFEELYSLHGKRVLTLAFRFTRDEEIARDLTQEIFLKVYQNMGTFREESSAYTWIHRIAVNHILNYLKRERRSRWTRVLERSVSDAFSDEFREERKSPDSDPSSPTPLALMETKERQQIVNSALDSLDEKYRVPFVLYRYEEMSYLEIAEAMNLSLSAVEARIHRAKKQLILKLKPWLQHI